MKKLIYISLLLVVVTIVYKFFMPNNIKYQKLDFIMKTQPIPQIVKSHSKKKDVPNISYRMNEYLGTSDGYRELYYK